MMFPLEEKVAIHAQDGAEESRRMTQCPALGFAFRPPISTSRPILREMTPGLVHP